MVSVLVHGLVGLGAMALMNTPRVDQAPVRRRFTTLVVKMQADEPHVQWTPVRGTSQPTPQTESNAVFSGERPEAAAPQSPAYRVSAQITLVQPDISPNTSLPLKTQVPLVMMWTPHNLPIKEIVPPPAQIEAVNNVRPSLSMPNHELQVTNVEISSTAAVSQTIPIIAGTTSFVVVPRQAPPQVPQSSSAPSSPPTPATVLSVSDVLLSKGTIVLPAVNETAAASNSDSLAPGLPGGTSTQGKGTLVGKQKGSGSGVSSGDQDHQNETAGLPGVENSAKSDSSSGADSDNSQGSRGSVERITRPKDGHFGVVIVGDSVAEQYPEASGIWTDRLAYTVYLHVGQAKTWILQYCLPRTVQAVGNTSRPDAPWPYLMVTPHLVPDDYDADALLIHGFIDTAGHFEKLTVVFPEPFAQRKFVLDALQQWQFRPALQIGQPTTVEVLLIIPSETD